MIQKPKVLVLRNLKNYIMLKNISNLGTELSKKEQKQVHGGRWGTCNTALDCKRRWANHPIFANEGFSCWLGYCQIL